ncbi:ATP-binding protein [Aeromonas veronii]|uniref:ATP-binding protein n=1 Tax=Aeromonas veronii TaxID=654 RepID=UPI003F79D99B
MKKIPFNVSARTARLIGRENVSSAEGALIELVKNSYDADADFCVLFFDDRFIDLQENLSIDDFNDFKAIVEEKGLESVLEFYSLSSNGDGYDFLMSDYHEKISQAERDKIDKKLQESVKLHIIDNGEGMTLDVIEKSWMTIGTDNKYINFKSNKDRIKSGAKGIGRFALDRLGGKCDLLTKTENAENPLLWKVNWSDFDQQGLTIDGVSAQVGESEKKLLQSVVDIIGTDEFAFLKDYRVASGTHISISEMRDVWYQKNISRVFSELEFLVPPVEAGGFDIYVFSRKYKELFGRVLSSVCDDFDYKLKANMNDQGVISFEIFRNELDVSKLTDELLSRQFFNNEHYSLDKLCGQPLVYQKTLYQLIPGLFELNSRAHMEIGAFNFYLYFLKRKSEQKDIDTFLHRNYNSEARRRWLDNNNGIRIYRDNFRVRPYGEIGRASWDWLGLGRRQAEDPSALRTGRWKVTPSNISGIINISRISNIGLEDKSSREGIQENDTFTLFCSVIESIIREFERDRSSLYREIFLSHGDNNPVPSDEHLNQKQEEDAEKLAKKIFENIKKENKEVQDDSSRLALALLKEKARTREIDDRLEDMKKENSLLRVFASSGITIASFTHELDSLNAKLGGRFDQLETLIRAYYDLDSQERSNIAEFKDPFKRIKMLRKDDERVKNWIKYSLRSIRKDKRKRVKINIKTYLENLRDEWGATLDERQVTFNVFVDENIISMKAYEIDLDCIFNNLIINSADAFKRNGFSGERKIQIEAMSNSTHIIFEYKDTGPGLSADILVPTDIFKPTFTTKTNNLGEQIGTGLGMWLVEKTVEEYSGKVVLNRSTGFSITMELKA